MNQQEIEHVIQEPHFQKIIQEKDFFFLKGQQALNRWLEMEVSEQMTEDLIRLSSDYTQFLEIAEINPEIENIKNNLFEIIAYCDNRAKDKSNFNQYDDDRILADASVRMGNWVEGLVKFKFKHAPITGKSILNAFNYLLSPQENCTILSENHRQMVSVNLLEKDYSPETFIIELKAFFARYKLKLQNQENYTYLVSSLVYVLRKEWIEEVIGLMASDGTGWQESATILETRFEGLIVWNSKKPSGGKKTLNYLKEKIKEGQSFPLYYSSKGQVQYKANIIDFAISQKELSEKKWEDKNIKDFSANFEDYKDSKKKAYILFLAESIEKISTKPISDFKFFGKYLKPTQDNLTPIKEIDNDEVMIKTESVMTKNNNRAPINQILFGPPGTGKTYNTINKALSIIENKEEGLLKKEERKELKKRFNEYTQKGQIVFTTFHQSMNYEDFIEGIKPLKEKGNIVYEIIPGIFKNICTNASGKSSLNFNKSYNAFVKDVVNKQKEYIELKTKTGKPYWISVNSNENLSVYTTDNKNHQGSMTKDNLKRYNNGEEEVFIGWEGYAHGVIEHLKKNYNLSDKYEDDTKKNFVMIIDEISRGNISSIFGELITLIEEDKRAGKDEALEIILPYSKEKFSVPPNLYIIGTMNTADRSVEALDTALRRRFDFIEMPPEPKIIAEKGKAKDKKGIIKIRETEINLIEVLNTINERIEVLLDRDHLIGHSYFMQVNDERTLKEAFSKQIIPLMQEYFYGDYGKIALVLGEEFCKPVKKETDSGIFASTEDYDTDVFEDKIIYRININNKNFDIVKAINTLLNKADEENKE